jgi:CO/xanthine dehydrogenase FAD-binding subunit
MLVRSSPDTLRTGPRLCLERVEELRGIHGSATEVRIGAATTHSELMANPLIADFFPLLRQAARHIGAPAVRNMGPGRDICTASPAGDTLPPLYILDAEVELRSLTGRRRMPIGAFITGPGQTQLEEGEVLCAIVIGREQGFTLHHFEKVGQRKAMAISVASLAFAAETRRDDQS